MESTSRSAFLRCPRLGPLGVLLLAGAFLLAGCESDTLYEATGPDPSTPPPTGQPDAQVSIQIQVGDRIERTDSLRIDLTGSDPSGVSGVSRLGYTLVITHADGSRQAVSDELVVSQAAAGDTISTSFIVQPDWIAEEDLPQSFDLQAYGWVLNGVNDCAAAVPEQAGATLSCRTLQVGSQTVRIASAGATPLEILAVAGRTTLFPTSSIVVGDLAVDPAREHVFISNRQSSALHHFHPGNHQWLGTVAVGSEPWGLHLNRTGDTLLVANSGGTSVSHVSLTGTPTEVVSRRLQTRNTVLFEVGLEDEEIEDEEDETRPTLAGDVRFFDFSDRPQFVSQDAQGRILYSTRPTAAASLGTVRIVENQPGWNEHETRMLARIPKDTRYAEGTLAVMNVDSIIPYVGGVIEIWDHPPGFPNQVIRSGIRSPLEAVAYMATQTASDIRYLENYAWELEAVSFADTTYVATSQNREFVAFGDGGQPEVGRIVLWHAPTATISRRLTVADLVNNASERVRALQLNADGSLGIARGAFGTYFFSNDLRLRGTVPEDEMGGGGAALHPSHPNTPAPSASTTSTLAFTVSADRTVRILDTVHYLERGRIPIRDAISGPMQVTGPLSSDNDGQGSSCQGADCVVAKLYAVTDAGGIVVVDIRASHISPAP